MGMKNLKRILFFTLALLFFCSVPVTGAEAASKITAKTVLKDALYGKQEKKDQVVVSLNLSVDINTKEFEEKTHRYIHGYSSTQIKGKDYVGVLHYNETVGDIINKYDYYQQYKSKAKTLTIYTNDADSNTYIRSDIGNDESSIKTYNFKKLYSYMSDIKFVKKNTVKNGQKAYCVSAKFDCAKYLNNEDSYRDAFASSILTLFPECLSNKNVYAKVTAYVDQQTGKMISLKFDMNQYVKTVENERFKQYYGIEDKNSDYSIQVKPTKSYIMFEVNPSKYKNITMPGNYKMYKYDDDSLISEITFEKNKKANAVFYSEDGFTSESYDKKGNLINEVKTNYADEYSINKEYKNGELINTTQIDRADSITVSNVKELFNAIGKYNLIYLEAGEYNLSDFEIARDLDYSYYYVNSTYDGFEYIFNGVDHLTLIGKGEASIVIEPRYSTVINIINSKDVTLKNLIIGHTKAKGECAGGVLYFENSSNITIDSCDLYGCGILGITTMNVNDLKMVNTEIHDCTDGIMSLTNTRNAQFTNCIFRYNEGYGMISLDGCTSITYNKCQIYNDIKNPEYTVDFIYSNNNSKILFKNCDFYDSSKGYNLTNDDNIVFKNCKTH